MADSDLTCAVLLFPKGTQGLLPMSACAKSYIKREPRSAQGNRLILGEDLRGTKSPLVTLPDPGERARSTRKRWAQNPRHTVNT
jgi:hypothetical protein